MAPWDANHTQGATSHEGSEALAQCNPGSSAKREEAGLRTHVQRHCRGDRAHAQEASREWMVAYIKWHNHLHSSYYCRCPLDCLKSISIYFYRYCVKFAHHNTCCLQWTVQWFVGHSQCFIPEFSAPHRETWDTWAALPAPTGPSPGAPVGSVWILLLGCGCQLLYDTAFVYDEPAFQPAVSPGVHLRTPAHH